MSTGARFAAVIALAAVACSGAPRAPAPAPTPAAQPGLPPLAAPTTLALVGPRPTLLVQAGHGARITSLAWSADGRYLASIASGEERVLVWSTRDGTLVRAIREAGFEPKRVMWSGDGKTIAIAGVRNYTAAAFGRELDSGAAVAVPLGDHDVLEGWLPDGRWLVDHFGNRALLAPDGTRTELAKPSAYVDDADVAPGGAHVVGVGAGKVAVRWPIGGGAPEVIAFPGSIYDLAAASDGSLLAVGSGSVYRRDAAGAITELASSRTSSPDRAAISADGAWIAYDAIDAVTVMRADGTSRTTTEVGSFAVALAFASGAGDHRLAVGTERGEIVVLDADTGRRQVSLGAQVARAGYVDFLDDRTLLVSTSRGLTTWDLATASVTGVLPVGAPRYVAAVPGQGIVFAGNMRRPIYEVIDPANQCATSGAGFADAYLSIFGVAGTELPRIAGTAGKGAGRSRVIHLRAEGGEPITPPAGAATSRPWTPPNRRVCLPERAMDYYFGNRQDPRALAASRLLVVRGEVESGNQLGVLDIETGATRWLDGTATLWPFATTSRDGSVALAVGTDGVSASLRVWNASDAAPVRQFAVAVQAAALSPAGSYFALAAGGEIGLGEVAGDAPPTIVTRPGGAFMTTLAISDRGLAVAGALDGSFHVIADGTIRASGVAEGAVLGAALSPDDRFAATITSHGSVLLWSTASATPIAELLSFDDDEWIAVAPDGAHVASYEATRRLSWQFDAPLQVVELARYRDDGSSVGRLMRRLRGQSEAPVAPPQRPPRVEVKTAPRLDGADVEVELAVEGGETVALFADGAPLADGVVVSRGVAIARAALPPGTRQLTAVAFTRDGLASTPLAMPAPPTEAAAPPGLWIVAIGVSSYPGLPRAAQLRVADDDAEALAEAFARAAAGREVHATVLTDDEVTASSIDAALATLAQMAPGDIAVVALAGHGLRLASGEMALLLPGADLDGEPTRDEAVRWSTLAEHLRAARGRVLVLLDACHAGAVSQENIAPSSSLAGALARESRAGTIVLAAAKGRQESLEAAWSGVFTEAVIDALGPASDLDADGEVRVAELVAVVERTVVARTAGAQMPWLVRNEIFGDFTILAGARPGAPAPARDPRR